MFLPKQGKRERSGIKAMRDTLAGLPFGQGEEPRRGGHDGPD